jgi:N-acetylneuraminic acid mutarotase
MIAPKFIQTEYASTLQTYDLQTHTWSSVPGPGFEHDGLEAVGGSLYAVGGEPNSGYTLEIYSSRYPHWVGGTTEAYCVHIGGGVTIGHDGRIYLMGGGYGQGPGSCLDAYDPRTNTWTYLHYAPRPVLYPALTTGADGRIYVLGGAGFDRADKDVALSLVQVYDPRTRRWTIVAPMPTARAGLAAVTATDGRIYAIGGSPDPLGLDDLTPPHPLALRTVEIYDPRMNRWSKGLSLDVARYDLAAVMAPNGKIYAIGGAHSDAVETLQVPAGVGRE